MNELFLRFLLIAVPVLFFSALRFCASDRARRMYIRVWLWCHEFCQHGLPKIGWGPCQKCEDAKEIRSRVREDRWWAKRDASIDKAKRLVKEL